MSLDRSPDFIGDDADLISLAAESTAKATNYTLVFLGPYLAALLTPFTVVVVFRGPISRPIALALSLGLILIIVVLSWSRGVLRGAGYGRAVCQLAGVFLESVRTLGTTLLLNASGERSEWIRAAEERMRTRVMNLRYRNQLLILITDGVFWAGHHRHRRRGTRGHRPCHR